MRTLTTKNEQKRLSLQALQMMPNEIFIGNTKVKDLQKSLINLKPLKTLRIGQQSFDITGLPLNRAKYRPLFLNKSEIISYDKIMTTKSN